jgi:APA family basic amino acid/polyamine antiporter
LREAWGARLAFLFGWQSLLVMDPGVTAALAAGLSEYLVVLWPAAGGSERYLGIGAIWILAGLAMAGVRLSARVLIGLTALKVAAFILLVAAAFTIGSGSWSHFMPLGERRAGAPPLTGALGLGLVSAFFSFGGFWEASRIAGEVRDAPRTMPRALTIGISCVTAVYVAVTAALIYLVPVDAATSAAGVARRAGQAILGEGGPAIFAAVVLLSIVTSILALLIMAPRLYVAMYRDGLFPRALGSVHPRTHVPARATALLAAMASLFVLIASFQQIVAFFMCTTLVFVTLAAVALIIVRRRTAEQSAFKVPGYPVTVALFALLTSTVVVLVAVNRPVHAVAGFAIVLLGVPAYRTLQASLERVHDT